MGGSEKNWFETVCVMQMAVLVQWSQMSTCNRKGLYGCMSQLIKTIRNPLGWMIPINFIPHFVVRWHP